MLLNILALLVALLLARGIARIIRAVRIWLGRGKDIQRGADRQLLSPEAVESWLAGERLSVKYRSEVFRATRLMREIYVQTMRIGWYQVVIVFVIGSVLGLAIEEVWMYVTAGLTQSRVGLVWGPFSPLYGVGAVLLTLISFALRRKHADDLQVFLCSVLVGGGLEQFTGWALNGLFHAQSWSYLHLPDHITQWIAWRFLLMWGILGLVWARAIMPGLLYRIGEPTTPRQVVIVALLAAYLVADVLMTIACFERRTARDRGIPARGAFEEWVDNHYTDEFMANRFQNMAIEGGQTT